MTKGDLPLMITWSVNGKLVKDYEGIFVDTKKRASQLSIDTVEGIHAGKYVCTATNAAGSFSSSAELNVNGTTLSCVALHASFIVLPLTIPSSLVRLLWMNGDHTRSSITDIQLPIQTFVLKFDCTLIYL